ncbi:nuclear transport factor 2 family protein [Algoriphagus hitonicola]|uniref:SnoaL-like domain-containing protein n=1 Tax=Algoriphagus hitonicola TaxID=435880 RepID=A0A1I2Q5P8_9BACT|nr:nuclear transport factor 2 family protein [Algoriphagus hitonicola]SFG21126.1 SnoaL-like domain-containing protein [Algoriphagus hitonicola]
MKKTHLSLILMVGLAACQAPVRYTQQSPEIETVKAIFDDFLAKNWEGLRSHYAEDAQIFWNRLESNPQTLEELITEAQNEMDMFSAMSQDHLAFEMVTDDEGEVWVNYWGTWRCTLSANGESFEIPMHETFQFVDGKVVKDHGYWDNSPIASSIMKWEAAQAAAADTVSMD